MKRTRRGSQPRPHADSKGRYSLINAGISGNPVTDAVTTNLIGNPSGNPKNGQKHTVLQGKDAAGYPVTTVTGVIENKRFEPEFTDPERRRTWDEWQAPGAEL